MTKYDKANELLNKLDFEDGKYEITDALVDMYDWAKEQVIEKSMKVICDGCAQRVVCEFNNWKTCCMKEELIKAMEE